MIKDLQSFLFPASIAIIGASEKKGTIPERTIRYVKQHGFKGEIYPINPNRDEIAGYKCYSDIMNTPTIADLVIIVIRAELVLDALKQCAEKGCKNYIIISSGFGEGNEDGQAMEREIVELAEKYGLNICGPNSQGFYNIKYNLAANFSPTMDKQDPLVGPAAIFSQSGAVGFSWYTLAQDQNIGCRYVIATGNEAGLNVFDFVEYLIDDPEIKVICAYQEGIKDGKTIIRAAKRALETQKPLIVYKPGKTEESKKVAMAHTGNISGKDDLFNSICNQFSIIRPFDQLHAIDIMKLITAPNGIPTGNRVAVFSSSGGFGVAMTDEVIELGMKMADFTKETNNKLKEVIPSVGSANNPVDASAQILAKLGAAQEAMRLIVNDPNVDIFVALIGAATGAVADMIANDLATVYKETDKPMACAWAGTRSLTGNAMQILEEAGIPVFITPTQAARAIAPLVRFSQVRQSWLAKKAEENILEIDELRQRNAREYIANNRSNFTEYEVKQLLSQYDIPITIESTACTPEGVVEKANEIGFPVVTKVNSADIPHKSEVDGIRINITNAEDAKAAYIDVISNSNKLRNSSNKQLINKVLVQEMVTEGHEVILGAINDEQFGPMVMFGLGGIYVEVFKDISYRLAPVTYEEAIEMINETKSSAILKGARGKQRADIDALAKAIVNFSHMVIELDEFSEIDVNPLMVLPEGKGIKIVDALMILK